MNTKTAKQRHEELCKRWYGKYAHLENEINEFTWDGASNWDLWESSGNIKILFLLKESHSGSHPSTPNQKIENLLSKNIARWKYALRKLYENSDTHLSFPHDSQLGHNNDDVAIIEIKKLAEGKKRVTW